MKEYHLNKNQKNWQNLYIVFMISSIMWIIITEIAQDSLFGTLMYALAVFSILGVIFCYIKSKENVMLTIKINEDTLIIENEIGKEKKINIKDIAFIQYDKLVSIPEKVSDFEAIIVVTEKGKAMPVCSNKNKPIDFVEFLNCICDIISAKEKPIDEQWLTKNQRIFRSLFVNPVYENSELVKKKIKGKIIF